MHATMCVSDSVYIEHETSLGGTHVMCGAEKKEMNGLRGESMKVGSFRKFGKLGGLTTEIIVAIDELRNGMDVWRTCARSREFMHPLQSLRHKVRIMLQFLV